METCYTADNMAKKIIICTTFREFNGNDNDQIQRLFLKSVKEQTHQDYIMVVTIFREKGVPEALKEAGIKHTITYGDAGTGKFVLSQVFKNATDAARQDPDSIVLWTTADTIYDPDYFAYLANIKDENFAGTSYPHVGYVGMDDFHNRNNKKYIWYGIDMLFFSSSSFLDERLQKAIDDYPNADWGYFEFLLVAWGMVFAKKTINTWPVTVARIDNNYKADGNGYDIIKAACNKNFIGLMEFADRFGLSHKFYEWILDYKVTDRSWSLIPMRIVIYWHIKYAASYLRAAMPKIKRILHLAK